MAIQDGGFGVANLLSVSDIWVSFIYDVRNLLMLGKFRGDISIRSEILLLADWKKYKRSPFHPNQTIRGEWLPLSMFDLIKSNGRPLTKCNTGSQLCPQISLVCRFIVSEILQFLACDVLAWLFAWLFPVAAGSEARGACASGGTLQGAAFRGSKVSNFEIWTLLANWRLQCRQ